MNHSNYYRRLPTSQVIALGTVPRVIAGSVGVVKMLAVHYIRIHAAYNVPIEKMI